MTVPPCKTKQNLLKAINKSYILTYTRPQNTILLVGVLLTNTDGYLKCCHAMNLSHKGAGGGRLVFPDRGELLCLLVITSKPVNPALNKDQSELGILVLPVPFQMLPNCNGLLDEVVKILRNFRGKSMSLEDTQYLASCNTLDLSNPVRVTKNDTNLGWSQTFLCKFTDVVLNILT